MDTPHTDSPQTGTRPRAVLACERLARRFGRRHVVRSVSMHVEQGETVGLLGSNGAGKTVTFSMIVGLVRPDKGIVTLDGYNLSSLPMYRRARLGIGYLPQEASVFRGLTVAENILVALGMVERDRRKREIELERLMSEFSIGRIAREQASVLSGGERRRVEIARAVALRPAFLLMDEPFAGVDPISVADIQGLVRHLKHRNIGIIITEHNVRDTLELIDRAYILHEGEVLTHGTTGEIVRDQAARRHYLGDDFSL